MGRLPRGWARWCLHWDGTHGRGKKTEVDLARGICVEALKGGAVASPYLGMEIRHLGFKLPDELPDSRKGENSLPDALDLLHNFCSCWDFGDAFKRFPENGEIAQPAFEVSTP